MLKPKMQEALNGQLNALDLGERRLGALLDEYGDATVAAALAVAFVLFGEHVATSRPNHGHATAARIDDNPLVVRGCGCSAVFL